MRKAPKPRPAGVDQPPAKGRAVLWIGGGHLEDIPKPHVRKFPGPKKRTVKVILGQWYGQAHHVYATLKEEDNPIWDSKESGWRMAWDDREGEGRIFRQHFDDFASARVWIDKTTKKEFPKATHELVDEMTDKRWHYKEGD